MGAAESVITVWPASPGFGAKEAVTPVGSPLAEKETPPVEPARRSMSIASVALVPCTKLTSPLSGVIEKSGGGGAVGMSKLKSSIATSVLFAEVNANPAISSDGAVTEISVLMPVPWVTVTESGVPTTLPPASYAVSVTVTQLSAVLPGVQGGDVGAPSRPT